MSNWSALAERKHERTFIRWKSLNFGTFNKSTKDQNPQLGDANSQWERTIQAHLHFKGSVKTLVIVDCAFSNSWYNKIVTNCPSVVIYRIHNFKFHKNIRLWHNFNDWQGRSSIDRGKWRKEEMERPPPRHRFRRFSEEDWQILTFGFLGKLVLSWGKSREHLFHLHCGALVFNGSMDQWYTVETAYKVYVCPNVICGFT